MDLTIDFEDNILKEIRSKLKSLNNSHTEWGWINGRTYPSGDVASRDNIKIAEIARINEYGGLSKSRREGKITNIPARPYFRQALMMTEQKVVANVIEIFLAVLHNKDFHYLLEKQARLASLDLVMSIKKQNMKPLAKKTVTIKGHDIQWLDTGVMMSNITFKVFKTNVDRAKV